MKRIITPVCSRFQTRLWQLNTNLWYELSHTRKIKGTKVQKALQITQSAYYNSRNLRKCSCSQSLFDRIQMQKEHHISLELLRFLCKISKYQGLNVCIKQQHLQEVGLDSTQGYTRKRENKGNQQENTVPYQAVSGQQSFAARSRVKQLFASDIDIPTRPFYWQISRAFKNLFQRRL